MSSKDRRFENSRKVLTEMNSNKNLRSTGEIRNPIQEIFAERHYSISELAKLWNLSENTIRRMFENQPDVLQWGTLEGRFKRRYRTLRIPERVVLRVHRQLRAAG